MLHVACLKQKRKCSFAVLGSAVQLLWMEDPEKRKAAPSEILVQKKYISPTVKLALLLFSVFIFRIIADQILYEDPVLLFCKLVLPFKRRDQSVLFTDALGGPYPESSRFSMVSLYEAPGGGALQEFLGGDVPLGAWNS